MEAEEGGGGGGGDISRYSTVHDCQGGGNLFEMIQPFDIVCVLFCKNHVWCLLYMQSNTSNLLSPVAIDFFHLTQCDVHVHHNYITVFLMFTSIPGVERRRSTQVV